ncbi:MAG: DUF6383 domain-containing protein, partial [Dysgonamonadaceae bacterium]|nr:DUF6383 domain-containing protein [Dysgonamonadaceae bacterium]
KKNYLLGFLLLMFIAVQSWAQSDITSLVLVNANFDEQWNYKTDDAAEDLKSANGGANIKEVYGWKINGYGDNSAAASYQYGYTGTLNLSGDYGTIPATGYNGSTGGALGVSSAWSASNTYAQNVILLAGSYFIEYIAYNSGPAEADICQVGWTPDEGDAILSPKTTFTMGDWELETIPFTLSTNTQGKIQIGVKSPDGVGSGSVGRIFFDYIKLVCESIDKTELPTLIAEANTLYEEGNTQELKDAIDAINAVIDRPNTDETLINAAVTLADAILKYKTSDAREKFLAQAKEELEELLILAEESLAGNYPTSVVNALGEIYTEIDEIFDELTADNIQSYIDRLRIAIDNLLASTRGLKIHYDFNNVTDNTVPNVSEAGKYEGTLYNEASIIPMGTYNVLSLGDGTGYLDMGEKAGNIISSTDDYTVSAYYRVDKNGSLSGNGHILWAFSVLEINSGTAGPYVAYLLNRQRVTFTAAGWNNETSIMVDAEADKAAWQHAVYRQTGNTGELYINGLLVSSNPEVPLASSTFTTPTPYNWIGRPPFSGDSYLKNTLVYDFRFYNQAVDVNQITEWAGLTASLDLAYNEGTKGDFTELTTLVNEYIAILTAAKEDPGTGVGQYPDVAISELEEAIAPAQQLIDADVASQFVINEQITELKTAYDKFLASAGSAMVYPEELGAEYWFNPGQYYIEVGNYYLTVPENGVKDTKLQLRPYINNAAKINNNQVWNIQYNAPYSDPFAELALYSFVSDTVAYEVEYDSSTATWISDGTWHMDEQGRMKKGSTAVAQSEDDANYTWREHRIYYNGEAYSIVNDHDNAAIVFVNETENETAQAKADYKKFNFRFRSIDEVVDDPKNQNDIQTPYANPDKALIRGTQGGIIISGADAGSPVYVYDISGRLIQTVKAGSNETHIAAAPGLYVAKVAGQRPVANKVIVR